MYNLTMLKNSLENIKEVCESFEEGCDECPLCNTEGDCQIQQDSPDMWDILEKTIIIL